MIADARLVPDPEAITALFDEELRRMQKRARALRRTSRMLEE